MNIPSTISERLHTLMDRDPESEAPIEEGVSWCYFFAKDVYTRNRVRRMLRPYFPTYVYERIEVVMRRKHKEEVTTQPITNLVFIQGDPDLIREWERFTGVFLYLRRDFASAEQSTAIIPHSVMAPLLRLEKLDNLRIIFTEHDKPFYAQNRVLVRGMDGPLKDFEGYIVRFHRDRMLVVTVGNGLTIAINGVNRSAFANATDLETAQQKGIVS